MKCLKFEEDNFRDVLTTLAEEIGSKTYEGHSYFTMDLASVFGKGKITTTEVSDKITNLSLDVTFSDDFEFFFQNKYSHHIDFIYCLEGYLDQTFIADNNGKRIQFRQNCILGRSANTKNYIRFKGNVPVKASIILYNRTANLELIDEKDNVKLRDEALKEISDNFLQEDFRYFGRVCFKSAIFAEQIINTTFSNPSDFLYKESAVLSLVASQVDRYLEDSAAEDSKAPLKQTDLDRVMALENFIVNNISENLSINRLSKISGLNPAKLQIGFNYLFNNTISSYIKDKRLDKAAELIRENQYNVSELVYSVGFSSRSYFSKIFKQRYGVLPSKCVSNPNLLKAV